MKAGDSVGEYSVGIATRRRIYETAKRLFYEKGVKDTSYKDICEAAEVNRGLIPYYFKSKGNIAAEVYEEFIESMVAAIKGEWGEEIVQAEANIMIELLMFRLLASDERACRFCSEIHGNEEYRKSTIAVQRTVMEELVEGAGIEIDPAALDTVTFMAEGTETELVQAIRYKLLREGIDEVVRRDVRCCYFLLDGDLEQVDQWCDRVFALAEGYTMVSDDQFNCKVVKRSRKKRSES